MGVDRIHPQPGSVFPGPDECRLVKQAAWNGRRQLFHAKHAVVIEGGENNPVRVKIPENFFQYLSFQIRIVNDTVLQFNIDRKPGRLQKLKNLRKQRQPGIFVFRMCAAECQGLQFLQGMVTDPSRSVRDTVDSFIMRDNKLAAAAYLYIQFHTVSSHPDCQVKGFKRVFRRIAGSAAVGKDPGFHSGKSPSRRQTAAAIPLSWEMDRKRRLFPIRSFRRPETRKKGAPLLV